MSKFWFHGVRWLALSLALVLAQMLSGMLAHALLGSTVPASFLETAVDWRGILTVAGAEAAAVYCLLTGLHVGRRHQVWIVLLFYWGTKYLQMLIEAAFFLNIWQVQPLMSWPELAFSAFYGTVTALLFAPVAVWIAGVENAPAKQPLVTPPLRPALKVGAVYVPIYFAAGALIAVPLAGSAFAGTYEGLRLPAWLPLFQFARGLLWAGILWLVIGNHGTHRDSRVTTGVALGIISSFQLLLPNPYMADQLRAAHLAEVLISMAGFGWLAAWIFAVDARPRLEQKQRLNHPAGRPPGGTVAIDGDSKRMIRNIVGYIRSPVTIPIARAPQASLRIRGASHASVRTHFHWRTQERRQGK